jgi:hypothetical protein
VVIVNFGQNATIGKYFCRSSVEKKYPLRWSGMHIQIYYIYIYICVCGLALVQYFKLLTPPTERLTAYIAFLGGVGDLFCFVILRYLIVVAIPKALIFSYIVKSANCFYISLQYCCSESVPPPLLWRAGG